MHRQLNEKLDAIRKAFESSPFNEERDGKGGLGIIACGHAWAIVRDVMEEEGLELPLLKIGTPFPLPLDRVRRFVERHESVLVIEEPDAAVEMQIPNR